MAGLGQWWRRALKSAGHGRYAVLLIAKSTLAATIAWVISYEFLHAKSPAFAPFSAVLIMQVTVYQSMVQALRYVSAVTAGVAVQGVLGFLAGPHGLSAHATSQCRIQHPRPRSCIMRAAQCYPPGLLRG
ncbi:aromatic acid exporter family protein [Streptomyces sioyaensis]|uniref:aromatic acid exporter family protein n=1 Tax=Streptomyces sioyaensis TaxID=67364 RepID=UPI001F417EAF|nr:aromatic acid exporter family protein [Streptomyces sioyaensis]